MITIFKIFERYSDERYMFGRDMFFIDDVMRYLDVDVDIMNMDEQTELKSPYNVNVIDFFKEILMNKTIIFQSKNTTLDDPIIKGKVEDVDKFAYKDEFWIKVNLSEPQKAYFLIKNNAIVTIYDYDADNKPLHKLVKLKKEAKKYNI